jgi:hypothetical protein
VPLFRRPTRGTVPEWASALGYADFTQFVAQLDEALAPYGAHSLEDGVVTVADRSSRYGLANLLQQWAMAGRGERSSLVKSHFENLFAAEGSKRLGPDEIVPLVRPRLWSSDQLGHVGFPLIRRAVAEGLEAVLCVDLPTTVATLKPDQVSPTGCTLSQLWDVAISQIDDGLPVSRDVLGAGVFVVSGDSLFVASRLLELDRFAGPLPASGALVAVPHRHMIVVHPIATLQVVHALNLMVQAADRLFGEGPGSIVPDVYWWRHDAPLLRIPASVDERAINVSPPGELLAVLNELPPE